MLLIVVMKFQDKFASLQQLHSPNWQDKFQICCIDMYVIRFLASFAVFSVFLWVSQLHNPPPHPPRYQKPCIFIIGNSMKALQTLVTYNIMQEHRKLFSK